MTDCTNPLIKYISLPENHPLLFSNKIDKKEVRIANWRDLFPEVLYRPTHDPKKIEITKSTKGCGDRQKKKICEKTTNLQQLVLGSLELEKKIILVFTNHLELGVCAIAAEPISRWSQIIYSGVTTDSATRSSVYVAGSTLGDGNQLYVDALAAGNLARFICHAPEDHDIQKVKINNDLPTLNQDKKYYIIGSENVCKANMQLNRVKTETGDIITLQATRRIERNELLFYSYGYDFWINSSRMPILFQAGPEGIIPMPRDKYVMPLIIRVRLDNDEGIAVICLQRLAFTGYEEATGRIKLEGFTDFSIDPNSLYENSEAKLIREDFLHGGIIPGVYDKVVLAPVIDQVPQSSQGSIKEEEAMVAATQPPLPTDKSVVLAPVIDQVPQSSQGFIKEEEVVVTAIQPPLPTDKSENILVIQAFLRSKMSAGIMRSRKKALEIQTELDETRKESVKLLLNLEDILQKLNKNNNKECMLQERLVAFTRSLAP